MTTTYPLFDRTCEEERRALAVAFHEALPETSRSESARFRVRAVVTGEPRRAPKRGEWYISGAIPAAYKAPNDLSTPHVIARLVVVERIERIVRPRL